MDLFDKIKGKITAKVISGAAGCLVPVLIIAIPIMIIIFSILGIRTSFATNTDIAYLDKVAFKTMVENNSCRNSAGVVMASEWLYSVGGSHTEHNVEYYWGGKSLAYGWDPKWDKMNDSYINPFNNNLEPQRYGLDCSGFVRWAFFNAGFSEANGFQEPKYTINADGTVAKWGVLRDTYESIRPGDYAHRDGHIGIVVETTEEGLYVIEEAGHYHGNPTNNKDLERNFYSFEGLEARKNGNRRASAFDDFYDSKLYYLSDTDSTCNWVLPQIYAESSNIFILIDDKKITLEEYVLNVIFGELNYKENIRSETLKALAIAIRSYVLHHAIAGTKTQHVELESIEKNNGEYEMIINVKTKDAPFQNYFTDSEMETHLDDVGRITTEVIAPTAGMVLININNNKIIETEYSTYSTNDVRLRLPDKEQLEKFYTDENTAKIEKMKEDGQLSGKYDGFFGEEYKSRTAHNRGIEKFGAIYMVLLNNWNYLDILEYYYVGELININSWLELEGDNIIKDQE